MKRILLPVFLLAFSLSASGQAAAPAPVRGGDRPVFGVEARFGGVAFDSDCWDDSAAAAGDIAFAVWEPSGTIGVLFGVGAQGASYEWADDWGSVESDVVAVPFGASLLVRLPLLPGLALRGEAGLRYVAMDIDDWDDDHYHHRRRRNDDWDRYHHPDRYLDVDDTSLALASLQLEFELDPVRIAVGGGYQFDLEKPDMEYRGERIGEVDLSGALFFISVGVVF